MHKVGNPEGRRQARSETLAPDPETNMSQEHEIAVIAKGGVEGLKEIQRTLVRAGIAAEIVRPPPEKCSS